MPWKKVSIMSLRKEFIRLAQEKSVPLSELCRHFKISRPTAYKWLNRSKIDGEKGLHDQSRRPLRSPSKTCESMEKMIIDIRHKHPAWGGRKIKSYLIETVGIQVPISSSTISAILKRAGLIDPVESKKHTAWQRFEHDTPNALWQMDFKGFFKVLELPCYPLSILDDHSRFAISLQACEDESGQSVRPVMIDCFRRYGLPNRISVDNGNPWGTQCQSRYSSLAVWLLQLGIKISYATPRHPQTNGKVERFHRTLKAEVLKNKVFTSFDAVQKAFDAWTQVYNTIRPHHALQMKVPAARYQMSPNKYPETLPTVEYGSDDIIRRVQHKGIIHFKGCCFRVGGAFHGQPVALRYTEQDGVLDVYFCRQKIAKIDLRKTS